MANKIHETCWMNGKAGCTRIFGRFAWIPQGGGAPDKMYFCVSRWEAKMILKFWDVRSSDYLSEAFVYYDNAKGKSEPVSVWFDNAKFKSVA